LNITSLLLVVLFDYTTLLISYTPKGDDTHKDDGIISVVFSKLIQYCYGLRMLNYFMERQNSIV